MRAILKSLIALTAATIVCIFGALPALACGGLVAPNGAIRLERATTLVAWHGGVEHYLTSFTYQGDVSNLGWIVPLPAIPTKIEEGGAWTLQRLGREVAPPIFEREGVFAAASGAQVIEQVQVEALDITVLKGSGQEVLDWCASNGFSVDDDTRAHLLGYAAGSPIFMAAKYNTARARERKQLQGDGSPVLITMPTPHLWVPLEVLALDGQQVQADLYLLTDNAVNTSDTAAVVGQSPVGTDIPGAPGFSVAFQERMTPALFHDLSTDRNMGWVRADSWLTYLKLDAPDTAVTYDLGISPSGVIRLAPFGTAPDAVVTKVRDVPSWLPRLPIGTPQMALIAAIVLGGIAVMAFLIRADGTRRPRAFAFGRRRVPSRPS